LLCHSMGNFLLQESLARIAEFTPGSALPRIYEHIFLCAPDVDDTALEAGHPLQKVDSIARNVTLYHNRGDAAMSVSDYTKGQPERLGGAGAAYSNALHNKVFHVDCTPIVHGIVDAQLLSDRECPCRYSRKYRWLGAERPAPTTQPERCPGQCLGDKEVTPPTVACDTREWRYTSSCLFAAACDVSRTHQLTPSPAGMPYEIESRLPRPLACPRQVGIFCADHGQNQTQCEGPGVTKH
jgi:hypothetical protein